MALKFFARTKKLESWIDEVLDTLSESSISFKMAIRIYLEEGCNGSFSEKLEFFSEDGIPLRARGAVAISSQFIQFEFGQQVAATAEDLPGTLALQAARSRDSVQRVMQRASSATGGRQATWQQVAALNGIENPRRLSPGTLLDSGISINRRTISSEFGIDINLDDDR